MPIDWFTVGAQAVNFLVLVWLLKRFLYRPILDAIDARERRIAAELADADAKRADARQERKAFERKNQEFDRQRLALLAQATAEATAERQRLLDAARLAADALSARRQEMLRGEALRLNRAILRRTQEEVFAIARRALTDLAGASLEERMAEAFVGRLLALDGESHAVLAAALKTATGPACLRSACDLPAAQRAAIQAAIDTAFGTAVPIRFETAPNLLSGLELTVNGQRIAWNIADYLASLEKGVDALLNGNNGPDAQAVAAPGQSAPLSAAPRP